MTFTGWSDQALDFLEDLEADNTKTFWLAHKEIYEREVLAPMRALVDELGGGKIFRPYRDVRFSKDPTPYKTHIAAAAGSGYVELSPAGLRVACGYWMPVADQLDRYRRAVVDDRTGGDLLAIVAAAKRRGIVVESHNSLKTAPRGYDRDHPRIEQLRWKSVVARRSWRPEPWLATRAAKKKVTDFLTASEPLRTWLDHNVGPTRVSAQG